jgi:hypothetical protein
VLFYIREAGLLDLAGLLKWLTLPIIVSTIAITCGPENLLGILYWDSSRSVFQEHDYLKVLRGKE